MTMAVFISRLCVDSEQWNDASACLSWPKQKTELCAKPSLPSTSLSCKVCPPLSIGRVESIEKH